MVPPRGGEEIRIPGCSGPDLGPRALNDGVHLQNGRPLDCLVRPTPEMVHFVSIGAARGLTRTIEGNLLAF